ncbi:transposase [Enterococcus lemanii]|uniref:Transposase n=1 Tax=Enterococcus lemanii TaxID=1159752 RepID=A0ABV9MUZ4_9ENTE|nr:transposase [Enterococcus lemanii]MBM7709270.1 IS4 transposase [Enterococcus lemanii]
MNELKERYDNYIDKYRDMYQARWQMELFFKHIKQNLTIKQLYSQSEQGAINQVILTLIATLLTYLFKMEWNTAATLFQLKRAFHYLRFEPANQWFDQFRSSS